MLLREGLVLSMPVQQGGRVAVAFWGVLLSQQPLVTFVWSPCSMQMGHPKVLYPLGVLFYSWGSPQPLLVAAALAGDPKMVQQTTGRWCWAGGGAGSSRDIPARASPVMSLEAF